MKRLLHFLVGIFMPVILIAGGAGLIGIAISYEVAFLLYVGLALIAAGVLWGFLLFMWASGGDW